MSKNLAKMQKTLFLPNFWSSGPERLELNMVMKVKCMDIWIKYVLASSSIWRPFEMSDGLKRPTSVGDSISGASSVSELTVEGEHVITVYNFHPVWVAKRISFISFSPNKFLFMKKLISSIFLHNFIHFLSLEFQISKFELIPLIIFAWNWGSQLGSLSRGGRRLRSCLWWVLSGALIRPLYAFPLFSSDRKIKLR